MIPIEIEVSIYDFNGLFLKTYTSCRYFKVTKNSLLKKDTPFYNQYQFFIEVPINELNYIKNNYIYEITVSSGSGDLFKTFVIPKDISYYMETDTTTIVNIIGINLNILRFLTEEVLCRVSDYDQFFKAFDVPRPPFSTSMFGFMEEGMFNILDLFYGPYLRETTILDKYMNKNTITIQNLPIMNNYDVIHYYFTHFYPVLDFPFFAIDDFFPFLTEDTKVGNYTAKLILNSYQTILNKNETLTNQQANNYNVAATATFPEIDRSVIYKFAYGDYIIHNIDHPTTQVGDSFTMPRVFGKKLISDTLKSVNTVFFDYPIDKISLELLRSNYQYLIDKSLITYSFTILNSPIEFFEINKIMPIDNSLFYIYGGEYEFVPIPERSVNVSRFKPNCVLKTLKISE